MLIYIHILIFKDYLGLSESIISFKPVLGDIMVFKRFIYSHEQNLLIQIMNVSSVSTRTVFLSFVGFVLIERGNTVFDYLDS